MVEWAEAFRKVIREDEVKSLITMDWWDGKEPVEMTYPDISIVTTCMNRLNDLNQTLERNIVDNLDYPGKLEFVVLDYNTTKDDLAGWIRTVMEKYLSSGVLVYYRTEEPKGYSMAHSRNVAFRLAKGRIVNSVDSDNLIKPGFASKIAMLATCQPQKAVFVKGRRLIHGRLGFYKDEFINELGGYDEEFLGYGAEDHDILYRACGLGYKLMWFGGQHYEGIPSKKHQTANFENKEWRYTEKRNKWQSFFNIYYKFWKANRYRPMGKTVVTKNFGEEVIEL